MNGHKQFAPADLTVFDVVRRFRLVVMEDQSYRAVPYQVDTEAQLVAAAMAAAQANQAAEKQDVSGSEAERREHSDTCKRVRWAHLFDPLRVLT